MVSAKTSSKAPQLLEESTDLFRKYAETRQLERIYVPRELTEKARSIVQS